jgi:anthranilate phosphoribosyltransferase
LASKAFHIELKVQGVNNPEQMQALTEALQNTGRQLIAAAILIVGDEPHPEIEMYGEDFIDGRSDIPVGEE